MMDSFRKHKQHSHHYKSHMMMPRTPFSHLIIGHATFAFRVFKYTLNPISLALHPSQSAKRFMLRCIGERNLGIRVFSQRFADNQSPTFDLFRFPIPHVNRQTANPDLEHPPSSVAKRYCFPALSRKRIYNITNFYAFIIRLIFLKWSPRLVCLFRPIRFRVFQIYYWMMS